MQAYSYEYVAVARELMQYDHIKQGKHGFAHGQCFMYMSREEELRAESVTSWWMQHAVDSVCSLKSHLDRWRSARHSPQGVCVTDCQSDCRAKQEQCRPSHLLSCKHKACSWQCKLQGNLKSVLTQRWASGTSKSSPAVAVHPASDHYYFQPGSLLRPAWIPKKISQSTNCTHRPCHERP